MKHISADDITITRLLKLIGLTGNKFLYLNGDNEVVTAANPGNQNSMRIQTASTTTLSESDYMIICNSTAGAITVNLPSVVGIAGRTYIIRLWAGDNDITIEPAGTENILGSTGSFLNMVLATNGEWVMLTSNGTDWYVVASNPTV